MRLRPRRATIEDIIGLMSGIEIGGMRDGKDIGLIGGLLLRGVDRGDIADTEATIVTKTGADLPGKIREVVDTSAGGIDRILDRGAGHRGTIVLAMIGIGVLAGPYPLRALDPLNGAGRRNTRMIGRMAPENIFPADTKNLLQNPP